MGELGLAVGSGSGIAVRVTPSYWCRHSMGHEHEVLGRCPETRVSVQLGFIYMGFVYLGLVRVRTRRRMTVVG